MKRNNLFIFQLIALLCLTLAACSGTDDDYAAAIRASERSNDTRAELIERTINVETAGTLGSLVEAGNYSGVQKLIVTGNIAYEDVNYVDVNMTSVEVLDLSGSTYDSEYIRGAFLSATSNIKDISLPGNITSINGYSTYDGSSWIDHFPFKCASIINVTLPEGLKTIGIRAFEGCSSLVSIKVPDGVTSIGDYAFQNCGSLASINVPDVVTGIGDYAFNGCTSLTSIVISNSVTSIGTCAFYGCSSLISITVSESVTSIGDSAFSGCSSLSSIVLHEGLTSIGYRTFGNCKSLTNITLPGSMTSIGNYAFDSCSSLISISIPDGVTSIGDAAFTDCSSLASIVIPDGVTSIGYRTFDDCSSLTTIVIPKSVASIGIRAFEGCSSLINITIPDGVTIIEKDVFNGCSSLASATIPEGVTSIGEYAFNSCESLTSIVIPESVTSIGYQAFGYCNSLTSITVPESVTSIGYNAFVNSGAVKMMIKWNTSCSLSDSFDDLTGKLILYSTKEVASSDGSEVTTAKEAVYTVEFSEEKYGASSYDKWYTISLPFKPTQITHETNGTIAPFDSGVEGAKNFWLRELTANGYQDVTEFSAGHPYIIAMPTSYSYDAEYRLGGEVTFSAENVTIDWKTTPAVGATYTMYPTYETVKKARDVYALNSEYWVDGYRYGFAFVRSATDVSPFEAYVKLNSSADTRSAISLSGGTRSTATRASSVQRKPRKEDM